MGFLREFEKLDWLEIRERLDSVDTTNITSILNANSRVSFDDFLVLISRAAKPYIKDMIKLAHLKTIKRFGRVVQLYAPIYLSNECSNICTYCGFSQNNKISRLTLNEEQMLVEIAALKSAGFDHILIVTGESHKVSIEYFKRALKIFREHFSQISFEVQPLSQQDYHELAKEGLHALLVYQETYNRTNYRNHHPKGKKSNFEWRLETADRAAAAGVAKIGLGVLLGLEDWQVDAAHLAAHISYLRKNYWQTKLSVSFPRLRPASGVALRDNVQDSDLIQLITALRIYDENLELSLSTREPQNIRDLAPYFGITSMSAGSKTEPGGYALKTNALEQFSIDDNRSSRQVASALLKNGFDAVWKDWQGVYDLRSA